ncbi:transmembrane protein, putative (macronuclear) [Tetrahymena thermophila SB210]|uniref:Transmembrane protein, putative n=1 Tax=Tetrahymena thermophila (strain SB210) TaxID=312017 RepID=W7XLH2_TETTS|nr:transmembrane protein, putative [Tetrahymena thermophila SB210]EWS76284.1 transmembrane protein, putative [Tetrahymena thermophila SB210]|eukprot:XP_012651068.1 transmembrane protein, putative [Tetrahymena thermophila SB210]
MLKYINQQKISQTFNLILSQKLNKKLVKNIFQIKIIEIIRFRNKRIRFKQISVYLNSIRRYNPILFSLLDRTRIQKYTKFQSNNTKIHQNFIYIQQYFYFVNCLFLSKQLLIYLQLSSTNQIRFKNTKIIHQINLILSKLNSNIISFSFYPFIYFNIYIYIYLLFNFANYFYSFHPIQQNFQLNHYQLPSHILNCYQLS